MKLIALKDFRNVPGLEIELEDAAHDHHVHKGATFAIGSGKEMKDCSKSDQLAIAQLVVSGCVGDANDEKIVKRVNDEVKAENAKAKELEKLNSTANDSALVTQLLAILKGEKAKA
jgi:hypothetical protein